MRSALRLSLALITLSLAACGTGSKPAEQTPPAGSPLTTSSASGAIVETPEQLEVKAKAGDANAQFELGAVYHDGQGVVAKDFAKAKQWFEKAAAQGEIRSQFNLGVMHYQGEGIPQNYATARQWFTKASDQGNSRAQFNLGVMYYRAEGVKQDFTKAMELFTKAARQGFPDAQFNLGVMYALGEGTATNGSLAYAWFVAAKNNQNPRATEALQSLESQMTPEQISEGKAAYALLAAQLAEYQKQRSAPAK